MLEAVSETSDLFFSGTQTAPLLLSLVDVQ